MSKSVIIGLITAIIVLVIVTFFIWRALGKPYYRISLFGTSYIENAAELASANERLDDKIYLMKKYKYSQDKSFLGFGGTGHVTNDVYSYGVADKNKNILIEPKFRFVFSRMNEQNESIIVGVPHVGTGSRKKVLYKVNDSGVKLLEE